MFVFLQNTYISLRSMGNICKSKQFFWLFIAHCFTNSNFLSIEYSSNVPAYKISNKLLPKNMPSLSNVVTQLCMSVDSAYLFSLVNLHSFCQFHTVNYDRIYKVEIGWGCVPIIQKNSENLNFSAVHSGKIFRNFFGW